MNNLFTYLNIINCIKSQGEGIIETLIPDFQYKPHKHFNNIELYNTLVRKDKLFLRSNITSSSLLRFENKNTTDNWAMSITIEVPQLETREVAGLYLYYTTEKTEIGPHNGGMSKFDGYVWGYEQKGQANDLLFIQNDGNEDLTDMKDILTKRDSINPKRLRGLKELTFKIIATSLNMKVELYNNGTLIYDYFRMNNSLGTHKQGKYFGIIADYRNTASSKAFILKDISFYQRTEVSPYSMYKSFTPKIDTYIRAFHEIQHGDNNVKELIHKIELVEFLTKKSLGELPNSAIVLAKNEIIRDLKHLNDKVDKLKNIKFESTNINVDKKVNDLDIKINQLKRTINELEHFINNIKESHHENHQYIQYVVLFVGIVGVVTFAIREMYSKER